MERLSVSRTSVHFLFPESTQKPRVGKDALMLIQGSDGHGAYVSCGECQLYQSRRSQWPSGRILGHLHVSGSFQFSASVQGYLKEGRSESEMPGVESSSITITPLCGSKDVVGRPLAWSMRDRAVRAADGSVNA